MLRGDTSILGIVNYIMFVVSTPILAGGIWLASRANYVDFIAFLHSPVIILGLALMAISLTGFTGTFYRKGWLVRFYLIATFFVIVGLLLLIAFVFAVTDRGHGQVITKGRFLEYHLEDFKGLLHDRVADPEYWATITPRLRDGGACAGMKSSATTEDMFYAQNLSPIQSGCCKPPSSCEFIYINNTFWTPNTGVPVVISDPDCNRWSNDQQTLCFNCDSCKAGVLAGIKKTWRRFGVLCTALLIVLVMAYVTGIIAFLNAKTIRTTNRSAWR